MIVTVCTVIAVLFLSSLSAFALSRYRIPFGRAILLIMLAGNLLPPQILLIPVSKICEMLGIYDTLFALMVVQVGFGMGFFTFVLYGFMRSLPQEMFEAAKIDGAGDLRIYGTIVLPLCRPALAALAALESTWVFNDLLWALTVLRTDTKFPITAALLNLQGGYTTVVERGRRRFADRRGSDDDRVLRLPEAVRLRAAGGCEQVSWIACPTATATVRRRAGRRTVPARCCRTGPTSRPGTGSRRRGKASRPTSTGCRRSSRRWAAGRSRAPTSSSTTATGWSALGWCGDATTSSWSSRRARSAG